MVKLTLWMVDLDVWNVGRYVTGLQYIDKGNIKTITLNQMSTTLKISEKV